MHYGVITLAHWSSEEVCNLRIHSRSLADATGPVLADVVLAWEVTAAFLFR